MSRVGAQLLEDAWNARRGYNQWKFMPLKRVVYLRNKVGR